MNRTSAKQPIREAEVPWTTFYPGTPQEVRGKALCDVGGRSKVGVGLMELPPGSDTTPSHYHTEEEEHLYVLSGEANLHLGEDVIGLAPGSYVCFPAGQEVPHHIHNMGRMPFRYLMIGERYDADQVVYPHSPAKGR